MSIAIPRRSVHDPHERLKVAAVLAGGGLVAVAIGVAVVLSPTVGLALGAGAVLLAVAVRDPALALALWMPAFSTSFAPPGNALLRAGFPVALLAMLVVACRSRLTLPTDRRWLGAVAGLTALVAGGTLWAQRPVAHLAELLPAALAILVAVAIVVVVRTGRDVVLVVGGLAAGPLISAATGVAFGDRFAAGSEVFGRLTGATGDANQLAAQLVSSVGLLLGLTLAARGLGLRVLGTVAVVAALAGTLATQSRGGAFALVAVVLVVVAAFSGRRRLSAALTVLAVAGGCVFLALQPAALDRISSVDETGTGRLHLWTIAVQMTGDFPQGTGLGGFVALSGGYARSVGTLDRADLVVENPVVPHNTFLQFAVETGLLGLAVFVAVTGLSLVLTLRAARRFAALGDDRMALLARGALVALLGFLVAAIFVSFPFSYRMWALLALGPALDGVARLAAARGGPAPRVAAS
ncbi:MAG: O-antigen polymerase [Solirubrobacterales bacterium]|nr:O-antigen polymerase [Solirubrobacterales bacterium]